MRRRSFQAMAERFPELAPLIGDIASRGRSLGVHLVLAAQQELDDAARIGLYSQIQKHVIDEALSIGFYVPTYTVATNGIQGLRFDSEGYPVFYDVALAG